MMFGFWGVLTCVFYASVKLSKFSKKFAMNTVAALHTQLPICEVRFVSEYCGACDFGLYFVISE